ESLARHLLALAADRLVADVEPEGPTAVALEHRTPCHGARVTQSVRLSFAFQGIGVVTSKPGPAFYQLDRCAVGGSRTHTPLREGGFKPPVSASSTTRAWRSGYVAF